MIKTLLTLLMIVVVAGHIQGQAGQQKPDSKTQAATKIATTTPTVDQIIDKYLQAVGGREAFSKITSRVRKGEVEIPGVPGKGETEEYAKIPNKAMTKIRLPALGLIQ